MKQNEEAFAKYRDIKVEGAMIQSSGKTKEEDESGISPFRKYKMQKCSSH